MDATTPTTHSMPNDTRRRDALLREIVQRCQPELERRGFRLDGRGSDGACAATQPGCSTGC